MSISKPITYSETGRDFAPPGNFMQNIGGAFITIKTFTVTEDQLEDSSYLFDAFENNEVFPLHLVQDVLPKNEEAQYKDSRQDFSYELRQGKYRHVLRFDWEHAFHQIVDTYSGTDLNVIYYDASGKLILAEESEGIYRGIKTNRLILEKHDLFKNGTDVIYSDLDIELKPKETLKVIEVDWLPEQIDKLFVKVNLLAVDPTYINFEVKYNTIPITNIGGIDVTISDDTHGNLAAFNLTSYGDGSYKVDAFSNPITKGCIIINATAYLGKVRYLARIIVEVVNNMIWEDGDNMVWEDGNNMIFEN